MQLVQFHDREPGGWLEVRTLDLGALAKRSEPRTRRDSHHESVKARILPRPQSSVACQIRPNHRVKTRFCNLALLLCRNIRPARRAIETPRLTDAKSPLHQLTVGHSNLDKIACAPRVATVVNRWRDSVTSAIGRRQRFRLCLRCNDVRSFHPVERHSHRRLRVRPTGRVRRTTGNGGL